MPGRLATADEGPAIEELDEEFEVVRATMGSTTYVVHELDITEYQKLLDKAKTSGDRIDNVLLLQLMVRACTRIMPKADAVGLTAAQAWDKAVQPSPSFMATRPTKVARKLNDIANEMHYGDIESDEEKADREKAEAEADGEDAPKGEDDAPGQPQTSSGE